MIEYPYGGDFYMGIHQIYHKEWIELYQSGLSINQIAKKFNIKYPGTVWKTLKRNGIQCRPHKEKEKHKEYVKLYPEWINLYQNGFNSGEIGRMYNIDHRTILQALKYNGIKIRQNNCTKRYNKFKQFYSEWIRLYQEEGLSGKEIAKRYGVSSSVSVYRVLKSLGIEIKTSSEANTKRFIGNEAAFNVIDSEEKAYWLGFISADGCVQIKDANEPRSSWSLSIGLSKKDKVHLQKLARFLGITCKNDIEILCDEKNAVRLSVVSEQLVQGLIKHNCVPNKTLALQFPDIPSDIVRHYIRGYFDGDGCVSKGKEHKNGNCVIHVIFTSGSPDFLFSMKNILAESLSIESVTFYKQKKCNAYHLTLGKREYINNLYHYMYDEATIWMERKREKYEELLKRNGLLI